MFSPKSGDAELSRDGVERGASHALVPSGNDLIYSNGFRSPLASGARPEITHSGITPSALWHALRRRWVLACSVGFAAGLVAMFVIWLVLPIEYEAVALIRVRQTEDKVKQDAASVYSQFKEFEFFRKTQSALMKSPYVLAAVLRDSTIANLPMVRSESPDTLSWLENQIQVTFPNDGEILQIKLKGADAQQIQKIVDSVTGVYLKQVVDKEDDERKVNLDRLEGSFKKTSTNLLKLTTEFNQLIKSLKTSDSKAISTAIQLMMDQVALYKRTISELESQLVYREAKIKGLEVKSKEIKDPAKSAFQLEEFLSKDSQVSELKRQQLQMEQALSNVSGVSRPDAPRKESGAIARLKAQAAVVNQQLQERTELLTQKFMQADVDSTQNEIDQLKAEVGPIQDQLTKVRKERDELKAELITISESNAEMEMRRKDIDQLSLANNKLGEELTWRRLDVDAPKRITLLQPADVPEENNSLFVWFVRGVVGVMAFCLAGFVVVYGEFAARRLSTNLEVSEGLGLRLMGGLPAVSGRTSKKLANVGLQNVLTESIDGIRTALLRSAIDSPIRTVMITSAVPQEGKTTVASQLAASLARSGRRTLLIDGDVRRPTMHLLFDLSQEPGLCEVLRGQVPAEDAVLPTRMPGLWLLPTGNCDQESVQALAGGHAEEVFAGLRARFDFVILDSGPVLTIADTLALGQHVDAAVLSVRRDFSQIPKVYEAADRLRGCGINVLGTVMNGAHIEVEARTQWLQLAAAE